MEEDIGQVIADGIEPGELVVNHVGKMPDRSLQGLSSGKSQDLRNVLQAFNDLVFDDQLLIVVNKSSFD